MNNTIAIFIANYTIGNSPSIINLLDLLSEHYCIHLFLSNVQLKNVNVLKRQNIEVINCEKISDRPFSQKNNTKYLSCYDSYISFDPHGFVLCKELFPDAKPIYYSLELYMKDDHEFLDYSPKIMEKERRYIHQIKGLIIQSQEKERLFRKDYSLSERVPSFILPVTYQGASVCEKSSFLRTKYGIGQDKKIALHLGGIAAWHSCGEIACVFSRIPDWVLFFQGHHDNRYVPSLKEFLHKNNVKNVFFSDDIFDSINDLDDTIRSCDVGIAWYNNISIGFRTAGGSSGKIPAYMRFGLPVIVKRYPSTVEAIERVGAGVCVDEHIEIIGALTKIERDYQSYSRNAREEYSRSYWFKNYRIGLLDFIEMKQAQLEDRQCCPNRGEDTGSKAGLGWKEILAADACVAENSKREEILERVRDNPSDVESHLALGLILWNKGDYKRAWTEIETAENFGITEWRTSWYKALIVRDDSENWGWRNYELARELVAKVIAAQPQFEAAKLYQLYLNGYYSQWGQDTLIEDFFSFNPPHHKMFVDVGAFDGITFSNTRRLYEVGWKGVCIEPVSENFQKCDALYKGTPVKCVRRAISLKEGMVSVSIEGTASSIINTAAKRTEQIMSSRLTTLLKEIKVENIDFLSIDVEGVDFEVLQSLDFTHYKPQLIVIEYNSDAAEKKQITEFMRKNNYLLWHDNVQDAFFRDAQTLEPPNFWNIKTLKPKRLSSTPAEKQQMKVDKLCMSVKKKPLSILNTVEFYHPQVGGAEIVVQQLSERLVKRGHRVTVATTKLADRTFAELNGVQIEEFDGRGAIARGFTGSDIARYQQFLLKHPADIMMNYAAQQWATDLAFDTLASTGNRRINIIAPCGYSALSDSKTLQDPQFADYFNKVIPTYLPKYDAAVYHSGRYQDYEFAQNHGFNNSVIIPNGVCEEEFSQPPKVAFRQKYNITTRYMGLCVANFYKGKGQDKIIECVRQMNRPDFTIVFIGKEGDEIGNLYKLASGLNVRFCVGIEREDTLAAYHEADIFLFGSEKECSPLVIVEAKASRTPFVSTDCGNVREWKGGVVCAPEKMAVYANRILDEEVIRRSFAEDGWKEWKEKLTWESVIDRYEQLYSRLYFKKFNRGRVSISNPLPAVQLQGT